MIVTFTGHISVERSALKAIDSLDKWVAVPFIKSIIKVPHKKNLSQTY